MSKHSRLKGLKRSAMRAPSPIGEQMSNESLEAVRIWATMNDSGRAGALCDLCRAIVSQRNGRGPWVSQAEGAWATNLVVATRAHFRRAMHEAGLAESTRYLGHVNGAISVAACRETFAAHGVGKLPSWISIEGIKRVREYVVEHGPTELAATRCLDPKGLFTGLQPKPKKDETMKTSTSVDALNSAEGQGIIASVKEWEKLKEDRALLQESVDAIDEQLTAIAGKVLALAKGMGSA